MKKIFFILSFLVLASFMIIGCGKDNDGDNSGNNGIQPPTNVSAYIDGSKARISWTNVSTAAYYYVYWSIGSSDGTYSFVGSTSETSFVHNYPASNNYNYYKVTSIDDDGNESIKSAYARCFYNDDNNGNDDDNNGNDDNDDDNNGNEDDNNDVTVPAAPTGVTAQNEGPLMYPNIFIRWNPVSNATSYKVYRSTSENGSYSQIGSETEYPVLSDSNPKEGKNYYKVKAFNSAGGSDYSSSALYEWDPNAAAPCISSLTATKTGSNIRMNWSMSTSAGCGKPSKITVKVKNPIGDWAVLDELGANATSYTFAIGLWFDTDGWVMMGIIAENEYGTDSRQVVYNIYTGQTF